MIALFSFKNRYIIDQIYSTSEYFIWEIIKLEICHTPLVHQRLTLEYQRNNFKEFLYIKFQYFQSSDSELIFDTIVNYRDMIFNKFNFICIICDKIHG